MILIVAVVVFLGICFFVLAPLVKLKDRRHAAYAVKMEQRRQAAGYRTPEQIRATAAMQDAWKQEQQRQQGMPVQQSLSARLAELDAARQAGQISEAEYTAMRTHIIQSS